MTVMKAVSPDSVAYLADAASYAVDEEALGRLVRDSIVVKRVEETASRVSAAPLLLPWRLLAMFWALHDRGGNIDNILKASPQGL